MKSQNGMFLDGALLGAGVTQAVKKRKCGTTILTTFLSFPNQSLQNTILALWLFLFCTESKLVAIYFSFHSRCIVSVFFFFFVICFFKDLLFGPFSLE